jgi:hypothetical protein
MEGIGSKVYSILEIFDAALGAAVLEPAKLGELQR